MLVDGSYENLLQGVSQQPDRSRLKGQCTLMENMVADPVDGLRRRPPVEYTANIGTYHVDNKIYSYDTGLEEYVVIFGASGAIEVYDLLGVAQTVNNSGGSYLPSNPKANLRCTTIGDYTITANTQVTTAMQTDIKEATSGALIYFRDGGEYGRHYRVTLDGTTAAQYTTPGGDLPATQAAQTGTTYVANQIYSALSRAGYNFSLKENVIRVRRDSGTTPINIQVSDDRGNLFAVIVQDETKKAGDLPLYADPGMVVKLTGEGTASEDDIYMIATGDAWGEEVVWRETVARGLTYKLDAATMPHVLVRCSNGEFYYGPLDGSVQGGTTLETWRDRDAGDASSNPERAFIGRSIEFITSFQERLVFLAGEFLIMSSTSSYFKFWNTTATALLKSDPIELANPATKATDLKVAIQHSKNLITFSEDAQFITQGSTGVTPETAAMSIATQFQADLTATPVPAGANVFFGITYGAFGGVRELFTDSVTAAQDSRKITEHVKRLIPGGIKQMQVNSNLGILAVLTDAVEDSLYIYQYLWDGEKRLQSAWSVWSMGGSDLEYFFFHDSDMYMLAKDPVATSYCFGKLDTTDAAEPGLDFNVYLDRKTTATPDGNLEFTIVDCPLTMETIKVIRSSTANYPGLPVQVASIVGDVVTLAEDPGGDVLVGRTYTSKYQPTMPMLRDQNKIVINTDRLIVNSFNVSYKDTGFFKVDVIDPWNGTSTQTFTGRITGSINNLVGKPAVSSGMFLADIHKDRDLCTVSIESDSYLPMSLIDIEWTGQFTKRGRRF